MNNKNSIVTAIIAGIGYLLFCSSIPSVLASVMSQMWSGHMNEYYAILSFGTGILFVLALYKKYGEKLELASGITLKGILGALGVGLLLFIAINFVVSPCLGTIFTASEADYTESVRQMYETPVATFFQVAVIAPIMEEIIFRGFLLKRELRVRSKWLAVIFVAGWFGILHMNVIQSISAAAAGIILCLFYEKRRSVALNILCHGFYNGMAFFLMLYQM